MVSSFRQNNSLSTRLTFLETSPESLRVQAMSSHLVFTFALLHNLHLEVSKLMKERTVVYLYSDKPRTEGTQKGGNTFIKIRARVLPGCTLLLRDIDIDAELQRTRIDFSQGGHQLDRSEYLQILLYIGCLRGMTTNL